MLHSDAAFLPMTSMTTTLESTPAKCNICGDRATFINQDRGKEGWQCSNCAASSRNRLVMFVLGRLLGLSDRPVYAWPANKALKILEPCPRGPQVPMLRDKFDYFEPEFDLDKIAAGADPRAYANVEQLAFADGIFDFVLASDVFEHVRHDQRGFREIYRTLKPEGVFIFTSPYSHQRRQTLVRVKVEDDQDIPLVEQRYAGGGGATLDYREYGRDVLEQLQTIGFSVGYIEAPIPQHRIHPSAIMVCRKASYLDLSQFSQGYGSNPRQYSAAGYLLPNRLFVFYKWNMKSLMQAFREGVRKIGSG